MSFALSLLTEVDTAIALERECIADHDAKRPPRVFTTAEVASLGPVKLQGEDFGLWRLTTSIAAHGFVGFTRPASEGGVS